ncbi:hypothetical protein SUGI_0414930 [Cryptomeria japonica]|uniref:uncharacterized protein LOC131068007 n=1 Tax=Cryptomeria japonica TaxID=3369 RepID=UPI002408CA34|nr:uncharacterized protein LOC131068007 [Cryptomeria japonica]GLJ22113.1 hypothetical protein SUGI_0414930 [Cryptomeria japonica]
MIRRSLKLLLHLLNILPVDWFFPLLIVLQMFLDQGSCCTKTKLDSQIMIQLKPFKFIVSNRRKEKKLGCYCEDRYPIKGEVYGGSVIRYILRLIL